MNRNEIQAKISELKEEIKQLESRLRYKTGVFLGLWGKQLRVLVLEEKKLTGFYLDGSFAFTSYNPIWLDDTTIIADDFVTYTNVQRVIVPASLERLRRAKEV